MPTNRKLFQDKELKTIAEALVDEFPNASSLSLAKLLHERHPLRCSVEAARTRIRCVRGRLGTRDRRQATRAPSPFTTKPIIEPLDDFPAGKVQINNWGPVQIDGPLRALVIQDLHIPYHHPPTIRSALDYSEANEANLILLNGDVCDFYAASRWQTDPDERNLVEELETTKKVLAHIRKRFKQARIIFKLGNHEERWKMWLIDHAEIAYKLQVLEIQNLLGLGGLGIELVEDKRPICLGELNVIHGHEYRFSISNPVNPARGLFLRCRAPTAAGHFHQKSEHEGGTVEGRTIPCWSFGCACDLHPRYLPFNEWVNGFGFVKVEPDNKFRVSNKVFKGGELY